MKSAWRRNLSPKAPVLAQELTVLGEKRTPFRLHVGGDFYRNGKLDRPYLATVLRSFRSAKSRPPAWTYTHAWRALAPHKRFLQRVGIEVLASVHNSDEADTARALGYRLAIDSNLDVTTEKAPARLPPLGADPLGTAALVCPAQRFGHAKVTCAKCKYCFTPCKGDVAFLLH